MKFDLSDNDDNDGEGESEADTDVQTAVDVAEEAFDEPAEDVEAESDAEDVEAESEESSGGIAAAIAVVVIGVFVAVWEKVLGENDNGSDPLGV